ncbi:MAG: hypothetical protein Q4F13_04255 [Pseudomonadota bacterium]|nr:hypothetical protein [Pseudomonadota bacterium]
MPAIVIFSVLLAMTLTASSPATPLAWPRVRVLAAVAALALGVVAGVCLLALHLFFESGDRDRLHAHLQETSALLARVDDTAALAALPGWLHQRFGDEPGLAVRVQGAHGQPLYEQAAHAAMPAALLARPHAAAPVPLVSWREQGRAWRGSALIMRVPLDGAAPLVVAMAVDVQRQHAFFTTLGAVLLGLVLAGWLALGLLAGWARRG